MNHARHAAERAVRRRARGPLLEMLCLAALGGTAGCMRCGGPASERAESPAAKTSVALVNADGGSALGGAGADDLTLSRLPDIPADLVEPGWTVHDLDGDGRVLYARPEPARADSDGPLRRSVALRVRGARTAWVFERERVLDARLVPGTPQLAVVTLERALHLGAPGSPAAAVDTQVVPPLAVAADGSALAYAWGDPPEVAVVHWSRLDGARTVVSAATGPQWAPVLSPDGRRIAFVSGASGRPAVYVADVGGTPRWLTAGPFHTAPSQPLWDGETLVVEDETGVHAVASDRGLLVWTQPGARGAWLLAGRRGVAFRAGGDGAVRPLPTFERGYGPSDLPRREAVP